MRLYRCPQTYHQEIDEVSSSRLIPSQEPGSTHFILNGLEKLKTNGEDPIESTKFREVIMSLFRRQGGSENRLEVYSVGIILNDDQILVKIRSGVEENIRIDAQSRA